MALRIDASSPLCTLALDDTFGPTRPSVHDLPPLPAAVEAKLQKLLDAFPRAYQPPHMTGRQRQREFQRHFSPIAGKWTGGEFDPWSVAKLLCAADLGPQHAFVDVGSGLGKLVVVAAACTAVHTSWGVELSPSRAAEAERAADQLLDLGVLSAADRSRMRLLQGNCADALPEEALRSTHFLFALRVGAETRGGRGEHTEAERLLARLLEQRSTKGTPRLLWSCGRRFPKRRGLTFRRSLPLRVVSERQWKTEIAVHEYSMD